jgi:GAF domain-containing protein
MPDHHRDIARVLVEFARTLSDEQSVEAIFRSLGEYCTRLLEVDGVGVLLLEEGDLKVATTHGALGAVAEHLEAVLVEGPCTDAIRTSGHVAAPDLAADAHRWPKFAPRALSAGVRGIYGLPIGGRADLPIGALNVVMGESRELAEQDLGIADMLADVAVSYMISVRANEQANELARQLQLALDSRVVIEQAKGMLAGRHGCGLADAFERMRGHARRNQERLHHVARQVCEGELDLP